MLLQTERIRSQSSALSLKLFVVFCLRYAVEATWKYISDNKDKYLPHSPAARLDFWFGQIFAAVWKGFVRFFGLYFCFADNLDFLTLPRCHLSKLGLLRNNCQIITQVGVHERGRIVFICRKIQVLLHSIEFKFVMWVDFFFKTVLLNL